MSGITVAFWSPEQVTLQASREAWEALIPPASAFAASRRGGDDVWRRVRDVLAATDAPMVRVTLTRGQAETVMRAGRGR